MKFVTTTTETNKVTSIINIKQFRCIVLAFPLPIDPLVCMLCTHLNASQQNCL